MNRDPTILIFDTEVKFLPSTRRFDQSQIHTIVKYLYDPSLVDYTTCTISNFGDGVITDSRLYDALKECKFIDSMGVFKKLVGPFPDTSGVYFAGDAVGNTVEEICAKVKSAIETVCMFYPNFPSEPKDAIRSTNVVEAESILENADLSDKIQQREGATYVPSTFECLKEVNLSSSKNLPTQEVKLVGKPIKKVSIRGINPSSLANHSAKCNEAYTRTVLANETEYVILKNAERDTLSHLPGSIYNEASIRYYIATFMPEFTEVGRLYVDDAEDIQSILRELHCMSTDTVWHLLQANATTTLLGTVCPSKKRIEKTIRKICSIGGGYDQKEGIAFKRILSDITSSMYLINDRPTPKVRLHLKYMIPRVLKSMGLKMKREYGQVYWYGLEDVVNTSEGQSPRNERQ